MTIRTHGLPGRRCRAAILLLVALLVGACAGPRAGTAGLPVCEEVSGAEPPLVELSSSTGHAAVSSTATAVAPRLENRRTVAEALVRRYPAGLRDMGIGGTAVLAVEISAEGRQGDTRILQSTGYPELDRAAIAVVGHARFSAAVADGCRVPVWVTFPVAFRVAEDDG